MNGTQRKALVNVHEECIVCTAICQKAEATSNSEKIKLIALELHLSEVSL